jgi:hypothetical protein
MNSRFKLSSLRQQVGGKVSFPQIGGSGQAGSKKLDTVKTEGHHTTAPEPPQAPNIYSPPPPPPSEKPAGDPTITVNISQTPIASAPPLDSGYHSPDGSSLPFFEKSANPLDETLRPSPTPPPEAPAQFQRPIVGGKMKTGSMNPFGIRATSPPGKAEPEQKLRLPKSLRSVANLSDLEIEGSLLGGDITIVDAKKRERKEGLCTACSKIDFEQFDSRNNITLGQEGRDGHLSHKLIFLDRILRKKRKGTCNFCSLIFDAIAEHDPFEHSAVKDYLPRELVGGNFREWAEGLDFLHHIPIHKPPYPFGRSRDNVELEQKLQGGEVVVGGITSAEQVDSNDIAQGASLAAVAGLNVGIWNETDRQRLQIMATVGTIIPTVTSLVANLDAKLPVAVSIIIHNANDKDAGLLNIDVWGYGNAPRAPLSRLSTFNLRIASSYQNINGGLQYGKLLQQDIDVEGDCKRWLDNCLEHHSQDCDEPSWWNELQPPSGPHFRLIDVYAMRIVQMDMASLRKQHRPKYAALSYVWGAAGSQALNLHVRNLESLSSQLEGQIPPIAKTIRDAIGVTGRLGLQYIWVDSLCIIQKDVRYDDDPDARASQIEQMDSIFGHAAVTLVAADGLDAEAGLCGISTRPVRNQIARRIRPNVNVLLAVKYNNTYGKWDTRAWTLQEKLLSKRILIFNGGYVSYHCQHGVLREDMPGYHAGSGPPQILWVSSLPDDSGVSKIKRTWDGVPVLLRSPFFTEYANLLVQYTGRDMTDSRDSLNAVMGLLKVLEKMANTNRPRGTLGDPDTHAQAPLGHILYGLPEKFLDLALLWHPPAAKGVHLTKRAHDYLPSWSWTAWEIGKDPDYHPDTKKKYHAEPGVRFEEPFWVSTNDDLSLKKVIARNTSNKKPAEERFKPLVMWYRSSRPPLPQGTLRGSQNIAGLGNGTAPEAPFVLVPVNGHGLGLAFDPADEEELRRFKEDAIKLRTNSIPNSPIDLGPPSVPAGIPIDNRHLVCETQVARFRLRETKPRQETLWKPSTKGDQGLVVDTELIISEAEILDSSDTVVGRVIPTDQRKGLSSVPYDFILLSESQYWGNEDRVDVSGLPLFNVMYVEWDTRGEFATRLGVGKVQKSAWWAAKPTREVVILK